MKPVGQVHTGRSLPELSKPGVQSACDPHGLGLHKSAVGRESNVNFGWKRTGIICDYPMNDLCWPAPLGKATTIPLLIGKTIPNAQTTHQKWRVGRPRTGVRCSLLGKSRWACGPPPCSRRPCRKRRRTGSRTAAGSKPGSWGSRRGRCTRRSTCARGNTGSENEELETCLTFLTACVSGVSFIYTVTQGV